MGTPRIDEHQEDFTEEQYREVLQMAKENYHFAFYDQFASSERVVVWRHDLDLSVHRAHKLAAIEEEEGVGSVYFVHLHNEFYHWGEKTIALLIKEISEMGHQLGLHFDPSYYDGSIRNEEDLVELLKREKGMLEAEFGDIPAFSFHNPDVGQNWLQYDADELAGMFNAYGSTMIENFTYCSDSNGYWRFARLKEVLQTGDAKRLHVLTHPGWWQESAMSPMERVDRCILGRGEAIRKQYIGSLMKMGRKNIGHD